MSSTLPPEQAVIIPDASIEVVPPITAPAKAEVAIVTTVEAAPVPSEVPVKPAANAAPTPTPAIPAVAIVAIANTAIIPTPIATFLNHSGIYPVMSEYMTGLLAQYV
ncbi:MAG: hypothetical protein C4537_07885 [Acholeplasma sp.]|nr:MAG: hypothetical protein C4537_07885 [Acholeplasma sp.]